MSSRPGAIASRAVNQYRGREIFSYLSLRYFLTGSYARRDEFARNDAVQIVRSTKTPAYHKSMFFKSIDENGDIDQRAMHLPGAVETLAESALLAECKTKGDVVDKEVCFSYWLSDEDSRKGSYEHYMVGLRARQKAIAQVLQGGQSSVVKYVDIKRFYPSISYHNARSSWSVYCAEFDLDNKWVELGHNILKKHAAVSDGYLLTGPMFSHFIANIVLRGIDAKSKLLPAKIFRYVDDFVLIGDEQAVDESERKLANWLGEIGLELHGDDSGKTLKINREDWFRSKDDFEEGKIARGWFDLVGSLKKALILKPEIYSTIQDAFLAEDIRLPLLNYETSVREATSFARVRELGLWAWLWSKFRGTSVDGIVDKAIELRARTLEELLVRLERDQHLEGFDRKRAITQLRFRLNRALYLVDREKLNKVISFRDSWPELEASFALLGSLISRNCDYVVSLGSDVSQSSAQVFNSSLETAEFLQDIRSENQANAFALFLANGVSVRGQTVVNTRGVEVAQGPIAVDQIISWSGFFQEFASLHGVGEARHKQCLSSAFDVAQEISFDATSFDSGYYV